MIIWTAYLIAESSDFHPATCTTMGSSDLQARLTAGSSSCVLSILASAAHFSAPSSRVCAQGRAPARGEHLLPVLPSTAGQSQG